MFSKNSKLAKRTYLALSLTTAMVAAYQPTGVNAAQEQSFGSQIVDAVEANSKEQVYDLLSKGINPNERGEFGTSALLRAANNGNLEIAKILVEKGANPNVSDLGGATPLHVAARKGDFALTQFLLKNKADVNKADKEGNTPLMLASINGNQRVVEELLANGANAEATNSSGETALLYATDKSAEKIVDMLVAAGAKNDVVDEEGYSIKEVAQRKNNELLVAKLDANDSNHVVIEMGRGFRSASSVQREHQVAQYQPTREEKHYAEREQGKQVLASLISQDAIDYNEAEFLGDPDLSPILTPRFSQIEPAAGKQVASAATGKKSWLSGLKQSFEEAGAFELASVKNFAEGNKYAILELGSFKVRAFAEKRISELQIDNMDVLGDVPLVIFERGTGTNLEYTVNGGIFDSRSEADTICQKLIARGLRCTAIETAMITNEQYAKFSAPVKSAYSAPEVEAVKIPDVPKSDTAATELPKLPSMAEASKLPVAPRAPAPSAALAQVKPVIAVEPANTPAAKLSSVETAPANKALAPAAASPAPAVAPALKSLAKVEAKPASPVVDAKSIAANAPKPLTAPASLTSEFAKIKSELAAATPELSSQKPVEVKPEIKVAPTVKTAALNDVDENDDDLSLIERAGMADDSGNEDAKKPEEKSTISSIVDSIYSEKKAADVKATAPAPAIKAPEKVVAKAEISAPVIAPESKEAVKKQIESLPSLPILDSKPEQKAEVAVPAAPKEPIKIIFADEKAAAAMPAKITSPSTNTVNIVNTPAPSEEKILARINVDTPAKLANDATTQPKLVTAPVVAPAPTPVVTTAPVAPVKVTAPVKVVAETVVIPEVPASQPVSLNAQPVDASAVDKFKVAKPIRVDDAFSAAPNVASPAHVLATSSYSSAAPVVTYSEPYIAPAHTFNRRENRRMARVDYFATPTAAQGLYWKYREAGVLTPNLTVRATKDILNGVHYSALIGEFSSSAEAQAFCNTVYKAEKLRCTVQAELDYSTSPKYTGAAKSYQRHSNYVMNGSGMSRHSSR